MSIFEILIYIMLVLHIVTLPKIFEKAGMKETWKGYIPVYNYIEWIKLVGKPWWWIFFAIVPLVNLIVMVALHVETARKFSKFSPTDTLLSILVPWYYMPALAFKAENEWMDEPVLWHKKDYSAKRFIHDHMTLFFIAPFVGHAVLLFFKLIGSKQREGKGSMEYEWTNAIGFAVVAATIIRVFFFEAFTIPTGSMEKTMRIGDYLFVNKMKYGARSPMTPISVPFIHNRIPGTFMKSYVTWIEASYMRLPGYGEMDRGDIMVFNWPVGDSVLLDDQLAAHDRYAMIRDNALVFGLAAGETVSSFENNALKYLNEARESLDNGGKVYLLDSSMKGVPYTRAESTKGLQTLVMDKKENYVKRCVGIHGDVLEIKDGYIYIDGELQALPEEAQFSYRFYFNDWNLKFSPAMLDEKYGIYNQDVSGPMTVHPQAIAQDPTYQYLDITCTEAVYQELSQYGNVKESFKKIEPYKKNAVDSKYSPFASYCDIFPNHPSVNWSRDNFGPLLIPEEGMSVDMTFENWILYSRVIEAYEGNESAYWKDGAAFINGQKADTYTFKQNYYWMMGDNRHGSVDSRYWGFVGEDHIVGTASFIWMSKHPEKGWFSGGLRFDRVFSFVE
jgi:signal peptidase I